MNARIGFAAVAVFVSASVLGPDVCYAGPPSAVSTVVPKGVTVGSGDVNGDGHITAGDALLAAQIMAFGRTATVTEYLQADVNFNGRIDRQDTQLILSADVGNVKLPLYAFKPGDVDGDGAVRLADLYRLLEHLSNVAVKGPFLAYNADANQDYYIDERDLKKIIDILFGTSGGTVGSTTR